MIDAGPTDAAAPEASGGYALRDEDPPTAPSNKPRFRGSNEETKKRTADATRQARRGWVAAPARHEGIARGTWSYVQLSAHLPHVGVRRQLELHARAGGVGTAGENEPLKQRKQGDPTKAGGSTA